VSYSEHRGETATDRYFGLQSIFCDFSPLFSISRAGNDITMVYYFDAGGADPLPTFDLSGIDTFGEVPQVHSARIG
jgi:hypothetical protein